MRNSAHLIPPESKMALRILPGLKRYSAFFLNDIVLKPLGLRISWRAGTDPLEDMKGLLSRFPIQYIVDGGAYRGDFSKSILSLFPNATVYAFEPHPASWHSLSRTASRHPRIKALRMALGPSSGRSALHMNASPLSSSLSPSSAEGLKYFEEPNQPMGVETVAVTTLAEFVATEGLPRIDLLKLDLQGYELEALRGMGSLIESVKLIYAEVNFLRAYQICCLFDEIDRYLQEHGFCVYQLYGLVRSPIDGRLLYGDAIFVNQRHIPLSDADYPWGPSP